MTTKASQLHPDTWRQRIRCHALALALAAAALALQALVRPWVGDRIPFLFFLPALVLASTWSGRGPGLVVLAVGLLNAMFVMAPMGDFAVDGRQDRFALAVYLLFGLVLVQFGTRLRGKAQRAVAAEERLVMAVEDTGIGIFDIDLAQRSVYLSPVLARLAGMPVRSEPISLDDWLARLPAEAVAESREVLIGKLRQRASAYERELLFATADGDPRWMLLRVQIVWQGDRAIRLRGAGVDITDRKLMDAQLKRTKGQLSQQVDDLHRLHELSSQLIDAGGLQAQLQMILHTLTGFHGTDRGLVSLVDGSVLRVDAEIGFSEAGLELLQRARAGDSTHEVLGQRIVVEDAEHDPRFAAYRDFARLEGIRALHSTPLISEGGEVLGAISVHFDSLRQPTERERALADICARKAVVFIERARARDALLDTQGRFDAVLAADLTERKHNEQLLHEAARRQDEFLATLAHELRNPLAPIRQAALLARAPRATEAQKRWSHEVIDRQVRHMALLLDDLLDASRITRGVLSLRIDKAELGAIIENAIETARPLIDAKRHTLRVSLPPEPVYFEADELRVSQVLANLLANAAKYTDAGGQIQLGATLMDGVLEIEVSDNGIGIAAESLGEIFQMFTQVRGMGERMNSGLGIGLALARGLVGLHGGEITARSAGLGLGSHFTIRLPLRQGKEAVEETPLAAAAIPPAAPEFRHHRVLIADDNRDAAESLALLMTLQGHEVTLAFDGREAVAGYQRDHADVCLLDIGMPHLNGNEVAQAIRRLPGGDRSLLVAITGWGQAMDRSQSLAAGFDHHLTKPVDPERLAQLLAAHTD